MTVPAGRRLILVVDADPAFVEDARLLLQGERVLTARSADEAAEIVAGGRVDVVLLGPSFGSESAVVEAGSLRVADPAVVIVLAANIVTNRILIGAMRSGVADVLDTPLTLRKLGDVLARTGGPKVPPTVTPRSAQDPGTGAVAAPIPAEPPLVTISLEAESESSTRASFITGRHASPILPPGGPIDEPAAGPMAPAPEAWAVPVAATPPTIGRREPVMPPVQPMVVPPAPVAADPEPQVRPVAATPAPPTAAPPSAPPPPVEVIASAGLPPPPSTPPPLTREDAVRRSPRRDPDPPVDLERVGLLPADGRRHQPRAGSGRVVAIMAGKGGSGKTITATNLAMALTFQGGEDTVVVVDADIQFGDVALLLQLDPQRTLADAVDRLDELSDARLDGMLLRHESGLRVMPAPLLPTSEEAVPAKGIVEVVERLRGMYQFVIVDTPPIFDDHLITVLECADDVLVVVDMDLPSVKNAKIALDALRSSRYPMERMRLVVNRVNAKARLDLVELERSLGLRVAGSIPSDRLVPQSVNEGIPVVALSPRSRVARSFHTLAQMLTADQHHSRRR
ncbi:MAG: AAA family ATPase [Actinomycetota bacterium]